MKKLFLLFAVSIAAKAQDATTLLNWLNMIRNPPATVLTVTASSGDGTVLTASKVAGSTINLFLNASNAAGSLKSGILAANGSAAQQTVFMYGNALCVFLANPTATAIAAAGSFPAVPATSVGWQCSTQMTSGGSTPVVTGTVSWP
jgi:hypothetical protein